MFKVLKQKQVLSTNQRAFELLVKKRAEYGSVIFSEKQTRGKGQEQTVWESNPGENLTTSLILNFDFLDMKDTFLINVLTAVSLAQFLEKKLCCPAQIKWPNDILIDGKKIAGILIENRVSGKKIRTSVIGIGLNINQIIFSSFQRKATSMRTISGEKYNIEASLEEFLGVFEKHYINLKSFPKETKNLLEEYEKRFYLLRKKTTFLIKNETIEGKVLGVNSEGLLRFSHEFGEELYGSPKAVVFTE